MNIEELREFCLSVQGATESFPFSKFGKGAENILVFKVMNKMFAYIDIFPQDSNFFVWLKSDPAESELLHSTYDGVRKSNRRPERNWTGVNLLSDVPDNIIKTLIQNSVAEVIKTLPQSKQQEYQRLQK